MEAVVEIRIHVTYNNAGQLNNKSMKRFMNDMKEAAFLLPETKGTFS
jgi:hypothetical protein